MMVSDSCTQACSPVVGICFSRILELGAGGSPGAGCSRHRVQRLGCLQGRGGVDPFSEILQTEES